MFENIVEQERIKQLLVSSMLKEKIAHAYLFCGPKGIGKETVARAFAASLRCTAPMGERPCGHCLECRKLEDGNTSDYLHVHAEKNERTIKIKQIRDLIASVSEKTFDGSMRICLITNAEQMTTEAQNALLKSIEEPFPGNVFLLTVENKEKILPTIRSRCQVLTLDPVSEEGIRKILENKGLATETDSVNQMISNSGGNPGYVIRQLESSESEKIKNEAFSLIYDIMKGKLDGIFSFSEKMGKSKGTTVEVIDELIRLMGNVLRAFYEDAKCRSSELWVNRFVALLNPEQTQMIMEILFSFSEATQYNINLRLHWESTLLKIWKIGDNKR